MEWEAPIYAHMPPIQKIDDGNKRKLSKRKDPEASVLYYDEKGYPKEAILEYLLNLANPNFEDWRKANPNDDIKEFTLQVKNLPTSGWALLDGVKLDNISKNVIARFDAEKIYQEYVEWAQKYDKEMVDIIGRYPEYLKSILNIEREGGKARKDIWKLSDIKDYVSYFFDELSSLDKNAILSENTEFDKVEVKNILDGFLQTYAIEDDKDLWFEKIKILCDQIGFAKTMKEYKHDPSLYKWSIVDVMNIIRLFLTWKKTGPDLFPIMNILWYEKVNDRLSI